MQISMDDVPMDVRRRVAQLLENVRGTEMDPTKGQASLTEEVTALFRPDLDGIAYYEFAVDLGRNAEFRFSTTGDADRTAAARLPATQGFVIAASERHDHPICHWSLNREPPTRQIARDAETRGGKVAKIFKVDSLSYVGESGDGELAGLSGQLPMPIDGLPKDLDTARGQITSVLARPAEPSEDDAKPSDAPHELVQRGAKPRRVKIGKVGAWSELRERYAESFGPLLKHLADQAAAGWDIEAMVETFGEGIMTGSSRVVALLERDAMVDISGPGAELVKLEPRDAKSSRALVLHVADTRLEKETSFDLHIAYGSGRTEHLKFFAVSAKTPSNRKPGGSLDVFEE